MFMQLETFSFDEAFINRIHLNVFIVKREETFKDHPHSDGQWASAHR